MEEINESLIESLFPQQNRGKLVEGYKHLVNKYSYLMPENLNPRVKVALALQCENLSRETKAARSMLNEDSTTSNLPTSVFPTTFAFPLIAQVFPNLVAQQLCSVQPMNAPIGKVYYKSYMDETTGASLTHRGNSALTIEVPAGIRKARMQLAASTVTAEKRMLQARWSTELQEDALALANLNVESDLMQALAAEVLAEIDWVILSEMVAGANNAVTYASAQMSGETITESQKRLYRSIVDADALVFGKRYMQTNFIIGSPSAVALLRKLDDFAIDEGFNVNTTMGVRHFGIFAGQWDVYTAPQFPNTNQLLMGIKGEGYIYAPYIALELMPGWYDPDHDEYVRDVRTRSAHLLTIPDAYVTVTLS